MTEKILKEVFYKGYELQIVGAEDSEIWFPVISESIHLSGNFPCAHLYIKEGRYDYKVLANIDKLVNADIEDLQKIKDEIDVIYEAQEYFQSIIDDFEIKV